MALGFNGGDSGDIKPIIKFDAKAGRMYRIDRQDGENTETDLTGNFHAVFDFENIEVGWALFAPKTAPQWRLKTLDQVKASGFPACPGDDWKQAFRMMVKLSGDGGVREFGSASMILRNTMNALHDEYEERDEANADKLPVVKLDGTTAINGQHGRNYAPNFKIVKWVPRPADLVSGANATEADDTPPFDAAPPSRGSSKMEPATADVDLEFG